MGDEFALESSSTTGVAIGVGGCAVTLVPAGRVRRRPLRPTVTKGEQEADEGGLDVSSDVVGDAEDDGEEKEGKGEEVSLAGDQIWLTVPRPCYQFLPVLSAPGTVSRPPSCLHFRT